MNYVLDGLKPQNVMRYFELLTRIPRGSGNEQEVSDYLVNFAKNLNLEVIQDDHNNIIIKKPATKGYENAPSVILQGHMDIVCVKEEGLEFDFEKDAIDIYVDGDFIKTRGTTLGADNGIAVAMAMAILDDETLNHPAITALITTAEETGMDGVLGLEAGIVSGDILINIDSEEEGTALASCAGGINSMINIKTTLVNSVESDKAFKITVDGLHGGHSGMEINKNRGNAIKLLGRVLEKLNNSLGMSIASIRGGEKMNAIAKLAEAVITINCNEEELFNNIIKSCYDDFKIEYQTSDKGVIVTCTDVEMPSKVFDKIATDAVISSLRLVHFGVNTMSNDIKGLVESSNNLGIIETLDGEVVITNAIRSSVRSLKEELIARDKLIAKLCGGSHSTLADYPEWRFKVESGIRDIMKATYKELNNEELKIDAIHAGLECGLLIEKVGDIDMISIGPNMHDVHTPMEKVSISSTERVYNFLVEVLKRVK
ncbi:MAG: aminoacyl-histidine dipeptidase [Acidaminobacteraceae bacterium]